MDETIKPRRDVEGTITIDAAYLRHEAREAMKTFVAPYTGIYEAITGSERHYVARDARKKPA